MFDSSSNNKRAIFIIIFEVIIALVIIGVILSFFKLIPIPQFTNISQKNDILPIPANATEVKTLVATYVLEGTVKSLSPGTDDKYRLILSEFPTQTFIFDKNVSIRDSDASKNILITEVKPGIKIRFGASYNAKDRKWNEIVSINGIPVRLIQSN